MGDALLDRDLDGTAERLSPDAPVPVVSGAEEQGRPGGAALAALLLARDGRDVTLVAPLTDDAAATELRAALAQAGVDVISLPFDGATSEKIRIRADGHPLLRLDRGGGAPRQAPLPAAAVDALDAAHGILVADYGNGVTALPAVRTAISRCAPVRPVVWDPHPCGAEPVPGMRLVTPNQREAAHLGGGAENGLAATASTALALLRRWQVTGVCVTRGRDGALLVTGDGTPLAVPAPWQATGPVDVCGAGDRFAAEAAIQLADGRLLSEAVVAAVAAASAFVAGGAAGALRPGGRTAPGEADHDAAARARAAGGTVVATGGCFDLLHAGHVRMLEAARALGDCLIVCLNSDASVGRLKGPGRPLVPEADRRTVLLGLEAVDDVVIFDEPTPIRVIDRLRPDVWVKGADYAVTDLPEAGLVARWGGRAVVVPYLGGRSTTELIRTAADRRVL